MLLYVFIWVAVGAASCFSTTLSFLSLFRGNKPALIGCLSQECNLTKVEQHLIAVRMLLLSSIGRKNLKCLTDKIRVLLCGNLSCSIAAALIISPANDNCRLIAKQSQRPDADVWCGLDCFSLTLPYSLFHLHYYWDFENWPCPLVQTLRTAVHWIQLNSSSIACLCLFNRTN